MIHNNKPLGRIAAWTRQMMSGKSRLFSYFFFLLLGMASFIWFLIRVIPKPGRINYPCVRASAPWAATFIIYVAGLTTSVFSFNKFRKHFRLSGYLKGLLFLALALFSAFVTIPFGQNSAFSEVTEIKADANNPIGVAKGIFPGRVVWVHDPDATDETCTNTAGDYWFQNTDSVVVEKMLSRGIRQLAGKNNLAEAWNDLFVYFNQNHGKGKTGYQPGEKIYIKINLTTSCCGDWSNETEKVTWLDHMDATPQLCLALLKHLVNVVGVAQSDIYLGDPFRRFHNVYWNMLHPQFPNVHYMEGNGYNGREQTTLTSQPLLKFSDGMNHSRLPQEYVNADYFINMPCLKTHNEGGITMAAKNHQGSIIEDGAPANNQSAQFMHYSLPKNNQGYGKYRHLVDYMGHEQLGGKTLLYLMDAIWGGRNWEGIVEKWQMPPFNNDFPSSLFLSQDPVAIESVGFDFLLEEYKNKPSSEKYPYISGVDDYLYQAADNTYWPTGITYDPEGDGTPLQSLGVYEHWNDPVNKQYSRNLHTGNGIELILVTSDNITPGSNSITTENSGLPSNNVNVIYVDSANVKWIGTDKGLARFDDSTWTVYAKNDTLNNGDVVLLNSNIKDIAYERTAYGTELWMATDSGLTVASYNVDGITSATTYHKGNSGIISNNISDVAVDIRHNRWIATERGISLFRGNKWDSVFVFKDVDHEIRNFSEYPITDITAFNPDSQAFITTAGKGVVRYKYNTVDGFTGASAYGLPWSKISSDSVRAVAVKGELQWYATNNGASKHTSNFTKEDWVIYKTDSGLIDNDVRTVFIHPENNNVWLGTGSGLSVFTGQDWYYYTENEGLICNVINHITSDMQGNVWIATPQGIEWFSDIPGLIILKKPVLIYPENNATVPPSDIFTWSAVSGASSYILQIDTSDSFINPGRIIISITNSTAVSGLSGGKDYYWRVAAVNDERIGPWSAIYGFTVQPSSIPDLYSDDVILYVFPNPANNFINLQGILPSSQNVKVSIFRINGQLVATPFNSFADKHFSLQIALSDQSTYTPGIYFIQITGDTFIKKMKIVIR